MIRSLFQILEKSLGLDVSLRSFHIELNTKRIEVRVDVRLCKRRRCCVDSTPKTWIRHIYKCSH